MVRIKLATLKLFILHWVFSRRIFYTSQSIYNYITLLLPVLILPSKHKLKWSNKNEFIYLMNSWRFKFSIQFLLVVVMLRWHHSILDCKQFGMSKCRFVVVAQRNTLWALHLILCVVNVLWKVPVGDFTDIKLNFTENIISLESDVFIERKINEN